MNYPEYGALHENIFFVTQFVFPFNGRHLKRILFSGYINVIIYNCAQYVIDILNI